MAAEPSKERERFEAKGILEPFSIFSESECRRIERSARTTGRSSVSAKGLHEFDPACRKAAESPTLVGLAQQFLGDDVIVWSTQLIDQEPGHTHRWHADIEAMHWPTLNVWIGLRNVGSNSFLTVLEGSHVFGIAPQDIRPAVALDRDASVVEAARDFAPTCDPRNLPVPVGAAVVFDGRLWHGSRTVGGARRTALLIQYSPARAEPRIPGSYERPVVWSSQRPACLPVGGDCRTMHPSNVVIEPRLSLRRSGAWMRRLR